MDFGLLPLVAQVHEEEKDLSYSHLIIAVNKEVTWLLWVPGWLGHKMDVNDLDFSLLQQ